MLLRAEHLGAIRTPAKPLSRARLPAPDLPIVSMSSDLLVGVFTTQQADAYLMVVDTRTSVRNKTLGRSSNLPPRTSTLTLHQDCVGGALLIPGGRGGYEARHSSSHAIDAATVSVTLEAGGGTLLELPASHTTPGCKAVVAHVRTWRFHPRTLSERGACTLKSPHISAPEPALLKQVSSRRWIGDSAQRKAGLVF
jgi:hypothetical protein